MYFKNYQKLLLIFDIEMFIIEESEYKIIYKTGIMIDDK